MSDSFQPEAIKNFRPHFHFLIDLPWEKSFHDWEDRCQLITELPQGVSRHLVNYINCHGDLLAVKEMPSGEAQKEYHLLEQLESLRLPVVQPVGTVQLPPIEAGRSYLVTRYLDRSLPYRFLFMIQTKDETRSHLLDAMASLLVQLHLAGIFWGDCSLSNTLFRHDAGAFSAYLVDAESIEIHLPFLMPVLRFQDLQIMEENVVSEMLDLVDGVYQPSPQDIYDIGQTIRQRYHRLWQEITQQQTVSSDESFKIQERVNALNALGFSIQDIGLTPSAEGNQLRLSIVVAGRNFHRDQLLELTGLEAEEFQARKLMNEIREQRAILSQVRNEDVPIEAASYHWLVNIYQLVVNQLQSLINERQKLLHSQPGTEDIVKADLPRSNDLDISIVDPIELYCQVLEHKWYLSEQAEHDVGHLVAVEDYLRYMVKRKPNLAGG